MFKTLLKKQLLELNSFYFIDKRKNKIRSSKGAIGMIIVFAILFLIIAFAFFGIGLMFHDGLVKLNLLWVYYTMMGIISIFIGTIGSVFNTYAGLYKSKDNDMLLAMPIRTSLILVTRMAGVYIMALLYISIVWIPTILVRIMFGAPSVVEIISTIAIVFVLGLLVTTLTCALGYIVALISSKVKNKTLISTVLYVLLFGLYYYVNLQLNSIINSFLANIDSIKHSLKIYGYPLYAFGKACRGDVLYFLVFSVVVILIFALCVYVMSRSFVSIISGNKSSTKKNLVKAKDYTARSLSVSLLLKELKRFVSSTTYFLNAGLGVILLIIGCIFLLVYKTDLFIIYSKISLELGIGYEILPVVAAVIISMFVSMDAITAPSISLEGKSLWILKSLPIKPIQVLYAKINLQMLVNGIGIVVGTVMFSIIINSNFYQSILIFAVATIINFAFALFGIIMNLKRPNLNWTNETTPIKQSLSTFVVTFSGIIINALLFLAYFKLRNICGPEVYLLAAFLVILFISVLMLDWIKGRGVKTFNNL